MFNYWIRQIILALEMEDNIVPLVALADILAYNIAINTVDEIADEISELILNE